MTFYQVQQQEDLLTAFDAPLSRKRELTKKQNSANLDEAVKAARDAKPVREDLKEVRMTSFDDDEMDFDEDFAGHSISFMLENIHVVRDNAKDFFQNLVEEVRKIDFPEVAEGTVRTVESFIYNIPKHEEELKVVTASCLFFYGGSWVMLASFIAAAELFDTKEVLNKAFEVGRKFLSVEDLDEEADVTPSQLRQTFKEVGMQFALMLAVLHCGAWAEICVSFAFGSKLYTIVQLEELCDDENTDKALTSDDSEWLALLSSAACAILSLIAYGIWPGLVVCMYMANIGLQCLMAVQYRIWLPTGSIMSHPYMTITTFEELLKKPDNQFAIWVSVTFTALWQAYYSFSGAFVLVSWLMFLLPIVHLLNLVTSYFTLDMRCLKLL